MSVKKSYHQLNSKLEAVLAQMQEPDVDIDHALELYKTGQQLIKELKAYLETAENTIRKLQVTPEKSTNKKP